MDLPNSRGLELGSPALQAASLPNELSGELTMFIAALFTITKIWKQRKCPSTDNGIKGYGMEYCSAIKRNEIMPLVATWVGPRNIILSEIRQGRQILCKSLICRILKMIQMNVYTK